MSDQARRAAGYVPLDSTAQQQQAAEEGNGAGPPPPPSTNRNLPPLSTTPPPASSFLQGPHPPTTSFRGGAAGPSRAVAANASAGTTAKRSAHGSNPTGRLDAKRTLAPGQPAVATRKEGRFVSLPESLDSLLGPEPDLEAPPAPLVVPVLDGTSSPPPPGSVVALSSSLLAGAPSLTAAEEADLRGRIAIYCLADGFDMKALATALEARGSAHLTHRYEEAIAGHFIDIRGTGLPVGDCFYFEYGCLVCWGLTREQESDLVHSVLTDCLDEPLAAENWEVDEFTYLYTAAARPSIANDTITLPLRHAADHVIKLSISHALAQSTKLMLYEELILELVSATKEIPQQLSATGKVALSRKAIAQLMGRTLNLRSAVQLSQFALSVPDFFWSAADALQALYNRVRQYVELEERAEVLSTRFDTLHGVLELARQTQEARHTARLEWVVIILIGVEIILGIATIFSGHAA